MPRTYEKIASTTLSSAASSITLGSIPATYTDLRVVLTATASAGVAVFTRFNSDTGSNYSSVYLFGDGSTTGSGLLTSQTGIATSYSGLDTTIESLLTFDIFSYAGSTHKSVLASGSQRFTSYGSSVRYTGLWLSTSAITSIDLAPNGGYNFSTGTKATVYGILKA